MQRYEWQLKQWTVCYCLFCMNLPSTITFQFINYFISDIHECLESVSVCGPNSHCYNYNGSFSCFCWGGFNVSDGNTAISKGNPCTGQFLFIWYSASVWKSFSTFGYCKMYKYIYFITILPIRMQIIVIIILLEMLTFRPNLYTFWIDIFKCKLCL